MENDPLTGVRLLVVEDDDDTRHVIVKMLEVAGASVAAAASAADALRLLDVFQPDALVSDINMPGRDGLWLVRELRSRHEHRFLPAVAVTARVGPDHRRFILAAGFQAHVPKPVDFDELIEVIRRLVAGSRSAAQC